VFCDREQIKHRRHVERAVGGNGGRADRCAEIEFGEELLFLARFKNPEITATFD